MAQKNTKITLTRRLLLRSLAASAAVSSLPSWGLDIGASLNKQLNKSGAPTKHLVLIELAGGNDGLNTVVPYTQQGYYETRPVTAIPRDQVLTLNEKFGLNPYLAPLMKAWKANDLQIALGVGYPNPNRSHFRSIDIWHTASGNERVLEQGWLTNQFVAEPVSVEGIAFDGSYGPLAGSLKSLVLDDPEVFAQQARNLRASSVQTDNPALSHVLAVRRLIARSLTDLQSVVERRKRRTQKVVGTELYKQLSVIGDVIEEGVNVPILKAKLTGFDTHYHQPSQHKRLMTDLASSIDALRHRLMASGRWENTLIMTYSEFGRRAAENGSRGTDHGTAAPLLLLGGSVRGGFSGEQPAFPTSKEKDLEFNLDYRQVYRSVLQDWFGLTSIPETLQEFERIDLVRS